MRQRGLESPAAGVAGKDGCNGVGLAGSRHQQSQSVGEMELLTTWAGTRPASTLCCRASPTIGSRKAADTSKLIVCFVDVVQVSAPCTKVIGYARH